MTEGTTRPTLAVLMLSVLIVAGLPLPTAEAGLPTATPSTTCDTSGSTIQKKLDAAPVGGTVRICPGLYAEKLLIKKSVTLVAPSGAVLDGSSLSGPRYAISIYPGVKAVTIQGIEIRYYKDLSEAGDPSSAIVALGDTTDVKLLKNKIHDNGWVGVLAALGTATRWTLENNTFSNHRFTHVFLQGSQDARVAWNTFNTVPEGIVVAAARRTTLDNNTFTGPGNGAIVIGPRVGTGDVWSKDLKVTTNRINGAWAHGIWGFAANTSTIRANVIQVTGGGSDITLGANPEGTVPVKNAWTRGVETKTTGKVLQAFRTGVAVQASEVVPLRAGPVARLLALGFSAVRADEAPHVLLADSGGAASPPPDASPSPDPGPAPSAPHLPVGVDPVVLTMVALPPVDCVAPAKCTANDIAKLYDWALVTGLNPMASSETSRDAAALAACKGQPASCLRARFFDPADTAAPRTWTFSVTGAAVGPLTVEIVDIGIRRPGDVYARHTVHASPGGDWTPIVICRAKTLTGTALPCADVPRVFDFGLDVTWSPSAFDRHVSEWHLVAPSDLTHASFDHVHGPDATLFKLTVRAHGADSPPPGDASVAPVSAPAGSVRSVAAGDLVLRCTIGMVPTTTRAPAHDCRDPVLVQGSSDGEVYWCETGETLHDLGVHDQLILEAVESWERVQSCRVVVGDVETDWATLFTEEDLATLAAAQEDHYAASDAVARADALRRAEDVFVTAVGRHLAIRQAGQGMPAVLGDFVREALPTAVAATLPARVADATSFFLDGSFYVLGGRDARGTLSPSMTRFDPATGLVSPVPRGSPADESYAIASASAVAAAGVGYVFGGCRVGQVPCQTSAILRFEPQTGTFQNVKTVTAAGAADLRLPGRTAGSSAVWDPRPTLACPAGCAYVFGGEFASTVYRPDGTVTTDFRYRGDIYRFDPQGGTVATVGHLPSPRSGTSAAFDGRYAYVFGGRDATRHLDDVVRFDPLTGKADVLSAKMPAPRSGSAAFWDGRAAYVVGGSDGAPQATVFRFEPSTGVVTEKRMPLLRPLEGATGGFDGRNAYMFGGLSSFGDATAPVRDVARYTAATNDAELEARIVAAATSYDVVDLTYGRAPSANVVLDRIDVADALQGWSPAVAAGLVAFTPVKIVVEARFGTLAGDVVAKKVPVRVADRAPVLTDPVTVTYEGRKLSEVSAIDVDGRGVGAGLPRIHSIPLVDIASPVGRSAGIVHGGVDLPAAASATACALSLWTARSDGSESNVGDASRLAVAPAPGTSLPCTPIADVLGDLAFHPAASVALELRRGVTSGYAPYLQVVDEPFRNMARDTGDRSLAGAALGGDAAVSPRSVRIVLEVPVDQPALETATLLGDLVSEFSDEIGIFAVEVDGLPLTRELADAVAKAATEQGTVLLVPAGVLPAAMWDVPPQDKLLTIDGLAADLHVITVGAGDVAGGVAPWSRRGPTAALAPKPDLLAPSPDGTTAAAVANVLPLVEAVVVRGQQHPDLVRAVLGAYAMPVRNEAGAAAVYWEQGFGSLDLSSYFAGLVVPELVDGARRDGETRADATARLAAAAGTTPEAFMAASPAQVFGLAADPEPALRAAVTSTLLTLALDTPALPQNLVVDFGVVNHNASGTARFTPIDLDAVLEASLGSVRLLLAEAGYTGTELDGLVAAAEARLRASVADGQEVTLDVEHYYLYDLLKDDFLYTAYAALVERAATGPLPPGASVEAADDLRGTLARWALERHRFVVPRHGVIHQPVTVDRTCEDVAVGATFQLANLTLLVLDRQMASISATLDDVDVTGRLMRLVQIRDALPKDASEVLSNHNQAFLASQSRQLQCLEDQKEVLAGLRAAAEEMRAMKRTPAGAWENAEAETGTWDATPLGRDLGATLAALGLDPGVAAEDSTVVLDALVDVLTRAIALLDQKMSLAKVPRVRAEEPTDLTTVSTDPAATRSAPLGPYVGLATMTSHDVTVYHPLTGEALAAKDVTLPVASLLWNNPSLHWTEQYRDGSPYTDSTVILRATKTKIFDSVSVDHRQETDGFLVDLGLDPARLWGPELDAVDRKIEAVDAALSDGEADRFGVFVGRAEDFARLHRDALAAWRDSVSCLEGIASCDRSAAASGAVERLLGAMLSSRTSRLRYQAATTDSEGRADLPNLFPGGYEVYVPYPYITRAALTRDLPVEPPAGGGFAGDVGDLDLLLGRLVEDTLNGLPTHPSAGASPEWTPFDHVEDPSIEVDGSGVLFHQSDLRIQGPDLMGVACLALRDFNAAAEVAYVYPGCGHAPDPDAADLDRALAYARCILGEEHATLPSLDEERCRAVAEEIAAAEADCRDGCLDARRVEEFKENVARLAGFLSGMRVSGTELFLPWARSPARILAADPARFGYSPEDVYARSVDDNPDADPDALRAAVERTLGRIDDLVVAATEVTPPPRDREKVHALAVGIGHHVTDRISGLDWFVLDANTPQQVADAESVRSLVKAASSLLTDAEDQAALSRVERALAFLDDGGLAAVNLGLASGLPGAGEAFAAGWRANGTIATGGLHASEAPLARVLPAEECAARVPAASGVQAPYFACSALAGTDGPDTKTLAGVDRVQFANVLLEEARRHPGGVVEPAAAADMLRKAAALSGLDPALAVEKRESGIVLAPGSELGAASSAGVLVYSLPLAQNEHVSFRLDGEFLMEGTGAILVASGNPVVSEVVMTAVGDLGPAVFEGGPLPDMDPRAKVLRVLQDALDTANNPRDTLLRVDVLGAPLKIEQKVRLPSDFGETAEAARPWNVDPSCRPEGASRRICEHGLAVARTGSVLNFTRSYEFQTKGRGPTGDGPETLDIIVVYFPLDNGSAAVPRKFVANDLVLQVDTYIGLGLSGPDCRCFNALPSRVGYRANIEDWHLLYAVPDQPLGEDALEAAWSLDGEHGFTEADLVRGLNTTLRRSNVDISDCPDDFASGDLVTELVTSPHGHPATGIFRASRTTCVRNEVDGLRPRSVEQGPSDPRELVMHSLPQKRIVDALQYVYNVAPIEIFSDPVGLALGVLPADPLGSLGISHPATDKLTSIPRSLVMRELASAQAMAQDAAGVATNNTILDLREVTPFVHGSFLPEAQGGYRIPDASRMPVLHNWLVLDETRMRAAMEDPWDWRTPIALADVTHGDPARTFLPARSDYDAQAIPRRNSTDYHGMVLAHHVDVRLEQPEEDAETAGGSLVAAANTTVEMLFGHGATGAGVALRVAARQDSAVVDADPVSFLRGHGLDAVSAFEVDVYLLGSNVTAGSDCREVPLWLYARAYFRCVGHAPAGHAEATLAVSADPASCHAAAAGFVGAARALAADDAADAPELSPFGGATSPFLAPLASGGVDAADAGAAVAEAGAWLARQTELAEFAFELVRCMERQGEIGLGAPPPALTGAEEALPHAFSASDDVRAAKALATTLALQPGNAKGGEPKRALDARLVLDPVVLATKAVAAEGPTTFAYAVDEWRTTLREGSLTVSGPSGVVSRTPLAPGENAVAVTLVDGATYTLALTAVDDAGRVYRDSAQVTSDASPPEFFAAPDARTVGGDAVLTWTVQDRQSGLASVVVGRRDGTGACAPWPGEDPAVAGLRTPVTFARVLDRADEGIHATCVTVTDRVGHAVALDHDVLVDATPPALAGAFVGLATGDGHEGPHVTGPRLDVRAHAWDNRSGLASLRVVLLEEGGSETELHDGVVAGADAGPAHGAVLDLVGAARPGATYRLRLEARDLAGNAATVETDVGVLAWIRPALSGLTPGYAGQDASGILTLRADVRMPDLPGVPAETFTVTVARADTGEVVFEHAVAAPLGPQAATWDAREAAPGDHVVVFRAAHGTAATEKRAVVHLWSAPSRTHDLQRANTYGALGATTEYDLYRITTACRGFTLTATGTDAGGAPRDVDLYLTPGDPASVGSDPAAYAVQLASASSVETLSQVVGTTTYTAMVRHKDVDTEYLLRIAKDCDGHEADEEDVPL